MGKLEDKIAIVTGAGRGIGHGVALALSKEGAAVAIVEMDIETCHGTADEIKSLGGKALPIPCDVRRREEVNSAVATTVGEFGTVDILVNNAQLLRDPVSLEDTTDELMAVQLESGLMGTLYFMHACRISSRTAERSLILLLLPGWTALRDGQPMHPPKRLFEPSREWRPMNGASTGSMPTSYVLLRPRRK